MKNSQLFPIHLSGLLIGLALLLAGCNFGRPAGDRNAARPAATSTPVPIFQTPQPSSVRQHAPIPAAEALSVDELSALTTEEQLRLVAVPTRDLRDLALRLKPGIDEIPLVVNDTAPDYPVGTISDFWVHNTANNSTSQIQAELVYKTAVAYAWVEVDQDFDLAKLSASIDRFSENSYPAERAFFGSELSPGIDNDPRIHILHTVQTGGGVAGYYSSADEQSRLANEYSNEKEMFYISLSWLNSTRDYEVYETVLAHEFQHMIHWANDRNEETWVNEGLSEFAQEVAGYDPDTGFASSFSQSPDTQLNTWNETTGDNGDHYGSAYLFMAYFAQRFGPELTQALVADPANGPRGFDEVLAAAGQPLDFNSLFADWVVANYVDDPNALGLDGVYGYRKFEQRAPRLDNTLDEYPVAPIETGVQNYATDYTLLKGQGDIIIDFQGQTDTRLTSTEPFSGQHAWWSNRGDDSDSHLTRRFDFTTVQLGAPLTMDVKMWWDIEVDYDYGYVLVSRDGVKWEIIPGPHTTTDNPSGNSFGAAYTSQSSKVVASDAGKPGWVTEQFDLSAYAGEDVYIRFEYIMDDAVNLSGWWIDDIAIPAIDYAADFENGADGWESEGWLLTNGELTQGWLLQVLELEDNILSTVRRPEVDANGRAVIDVTGLGNGKTAVLAISALAPVTTETANYSFEIKTR
ncbi:MAG: immune inhibitor A [Caldilineaceae bacterium]